MKSSVRTFSELTNFELYEIMRLRQDVFVVEQQCLFRDIDGRDLSASHMLLERDGSVMAYCRILPPDESDETVAIGRFVVSQHVRRQGYGHAMMSDAVRFCQQTFPRNAILIRAQSHLTAFYEKHGFHQVGDEYIEDGIPHTELIRSVR